MTELKPSQKFASKTIHISTVLLVLSGTVNAQNISPAQRQEFNDAKSEISNAQKGAYLKYASSELKQAQDSLQAAESSTDPVKYAQNTRLARAQAQLAIAVTELGVETDRLADTNQALAKARDEVSQLGKTK
jgi:hypothetical protein